VRTTGAPTGNVVPISRGFDGTTPVVHLASAVVSGFVDAWHHNALTAEIEAIEQALGPNLSAIPASPWLISKTYDFAAQTPGGSLVVGANSITLTPVPAGINGSNTGHSLYISGGTGTAEAALIIGGSAVSGAATGTVIVQCANTHSGAWTIKSATAGIMEALYAAGQVGNVAQGSILIPAGTHTIYGTIVLRNNGLALRFPGHGAPYIDGMCEIQVLDDDYENATGSKIDPRQAHGSAYGMVAAHRGYQHPIGDWNYQETTVKGSTIKVELNGTVILDCDLAKVTNFLGDHPHPGKDRTKGYFGFAGHNDPVMFRNISIKPLD